MKTLGGILGFIGGAVFGLYAYYSFDGIRHCFGAFDNCEDLYTLIPQFANKIPLTDYILMGSETSGLSEEVRQQIPDQDKIRIPMLKMGQEYILNQKMELQSYIKDEIIYNVRAIEYARQLAILAMRNWRTDTGTTNDPIYVPRLYSANDSVAYFCCIISPCSVTRVLPFTVPGG